MSEDRLSTGEEYSESGINLDRIRRNDLINIKKAADRPKDQLDLLELREIEGLQAETDENSGSGDRGLTG